jgi:hypothetical protein
MPQVVVQPFDIRDIPLCLRLQRHGTPLHLEQAAVRPRSPLSRALLSPLPWHGTDVATYMLRGTGPDCALRGFAQMRKRPARPEADILFLAPDGQAGSIVADIWSRLLYQCCYEAGHNGVQRIYATVPDESLFVDTFRQAGFSLYTREMVLCLERTNTLPDIPRDTVINAFDEEKSGALLRLYSSSTPRSVQQAEGGSNGDACVPQDITPDLSFVLEEKGEIAAALQIEIGWAGHWLRLLGDSQDSEKMVALLVRGLRALSAYRSHPVYCTVRDYQGGLQAILMDLGFVPYARWNRLVKYTVARVKEPALKPVPVLEHGVGPTFTAAKDGNGRGDRTLPEPAHTRGMKG